MSCPFNAVKNENESYVVGHVKKIKDPPLSCFESEECSSNDELSRMCFNGALSFPVVEVSCSSSDSVMSSGSEVSTTEILSRKAKYFEDSEVLCSYMRDGTCIQVNKSSESRQGRDNQRWDKENDKSSLTRLTTGVVPITNDGRIVFVSSARKKEWILPKGGWETDETMEESALRETFEEAGLLGFLGGSKLTEISFETRKAKKLRLDGLHLAKRLESDYDSTAETQSDTNSATVSFEDCHTNASSLSLKQSNVPTFSPPVSNSESNNTSAPPRTISLVKEGHSPKDCVGMCRMTLFPFYITKVLDTWPESGRSRKACTIDEAIDLARPEFRAVLIEVREKGLHLPSDTNQV